MLRRVSLTKAERSVPSLAVFTTRGLASKPRPGPPCRPGAISEPAARPVGARKRGGEAFIQQLGVPTLLDGAEDARPKIGDRDLRLNGSGILKPAVDEESRVRRHDRRRPAERPKLFSARIVERQDEMIAIMKRT